MASAWRGEMRNLISFILLALIQNLNFFLNSFMKIQLQSFKFKIANLALHLIQNFYNSILI